MKSFFVHRTTRTTAQASVLALMVGGVFGYGSMQKDVTIDLNGKVEQASGMASTVGDVLAANDIEVGKRDLVSPGLDAKVQDGQEIVVRHARQVELVVDGAEKPAWTTALTVGEALEDLEIRDQEATVSASRSQKISRDGLTLVVTTPKKVTVDVDGETKTETIAAETVGEALGEMGVKIGKHDKMWTNDSFVEKNAKLSGDTNLAVYRVKYETVEKTEKIDFEITKKESEDLYEGEEEVETEGIEGVKTKNYKVKYVDGEKRAGDLVSEKVTKKPVDEVVLVGTKERETEPEEEVEPEDAEESEDSAPVPTGSNREIGKGLAAARGWTGQQWTCLESLWTKESGWNHTASNPSSGAYGIPQALPGTKMNSAGPDWRTNPATQIKWGLDYIAGRYGNPCGAWAHSQAVNWY